MNYEVDEAQPDTMRNRGRAYNRKRHDDPTVTLYWIATADNAKKVVLSSLSCMWCKTTLFDEMMGTITTVINAPVGLDDFGLAGTVRCRFCKQKYRLAIPKSELFK